MFSDKPVLEVYGSLDITYRYAHKVWGFQLYGPQNGSEYEATHPWRIVVQYWYYADEVGRRQPYIMADREIPFDMGIRLIINTPWFINMRLPLNHFSAALVRRLYRGTLGNEVKRRRISLAEFDQWLRDARLPVPIVTHC